MILTGFNKDLHCKECATKIMAELELAGRKPMDVVDEYSYDGDDYPKYAGPDGGGEADDELMPNALEVVRLTRRASTTMLQRRLRIGYTRAARLMDMLEERGVVGPQVGSGTREILIDLDNEIPGHAGLADDDAEASPAIDSGVAETTDDRV